jgi:excisionase family DNA binding protein
MSQNSAAFISVPEVTELLGVDRNAVYRMAKSGQIPAIIDGRRIRIIRQALMEKLAGNPGAAPAAVDPQVLAEEVRILELQSRLPREQAELEELLERKARRLGRTVVSSRRRA